ncbi:MAG: hypothetical protein QGF09_06975, partial [Rhodospirillales bacterium]|nr:hypothetical protein [Rhodospirillales bacterium]
MDKKIKHVACRPGWMLGGALLSVAILAGPDGALAQSDWKAKWAKTVAAANKEGKVVANVQPNRAMRKYWKTNWPKAYPKIKLSLNVVRGSVMVKRIQTERKAGKYLWDFGFSGGNTGYRLWRKGILDPMKPEFIKPDINNPKTWGGWDNIFYDKQKKYVMSVQFGLKPPFYNAKVIPPAKAKKMGIKLLLDPVYKGKIVWHDPRVRGSGRGFARLLQKQFGDR